MELGDLEWGDVLVDTGEVMVVEARLGEDRVLVKRWGQGVLDAELCARRLLDAAGVAQAQLLGDGPGWLVLEDLGETMWRPATSEDLADPGTVAALGRWLAQVHAISPNGLPAAPTEALSSSEVLEAALPLVATDLANRIVPAVSRWGEVLREVPACLVVGGFRPDDIRVLGPGMAAMATDLTAAHAGPAASDLSQLRGLLEGVGSGCWDALWEAYQGAADRPVPAEEVAAAAGLQQVLEVVLGALAGAPVAPSPRLLALLDAGR